MHVESVAWISERKDVLSTRSSRCYPFWPMHVTRRRGGWLQQALAMVKRNRNPRPTLRIRQALLHPGIARVHPEPHGQTNAGDVPLFLLLLLDYWPLKRLAISAQTSFVKTGVALLREKIPFLTLTAASAASAYWIQASRHNLGGLAQFPLSLRAANAVMSYFLYVRKMFWPTDLAAFYPYPDELPITPVAAAGAILALITLLAVLSIRRLPYLAVGWFWFLGTLVPMIGLVQVSHHAMADRYTYVPMIGCFIAIVWGIAEKLAADMRLAAIAGAVCLLGVGWVGARQVGYWRNSETLFRHAIEVTKNNYVAHDNLGAALDQKGQYDEALANFEEAFRIECALKSNPDLSAIRFTTSARPFSGRET